MTKIYGFNDKYQMVEILVDQDPVALFDREHNQETEKWVFDKNGKAVKAEPKVVAETKVTAAVETETKVAKASRKPPYYVAATVEPKVTVEPQWKKIRIVKDTIILILEPMRRPAMRRSDYKKVGAIDRMIDLLKRAKISTDPDQPGFLGSFIIESDLNEWDSILNDDGIWGLMSDLDIDLEFKFNRIFIH